jgi:hypothetical protein
MRITARRMWAFGKEGMRTIEKKPKRGNSSWRELLAKIKGILGRVVYISMKLETERGEYKPNYFQANKRNSN